MPFARKFGNPQEAQHAPNSLESQIFWQRAFDFVVVLLGYVISGENTLEAFYEHVRPWVCAFMALFGRDRLPARSTPSRFLAGLRLLRAKALR